MRCSFPTCDHDSRKNSSSGVSFHRVPKELSLREAWMKALGQTDWDPEPGSSVCSKHFLAEDLLTLMGHQLQMCRICFATDCKIYPISSSTVLNKAYETLTGIMTADEEHLPRYLCTQCADRLMNCVRFRLRSLRAHLMLLDIFKRYGQITVDLIRSDLQNHNPFSSDPADNPNEEYLDFGNGALEEINKQTDARTDTSLDVDMYVKPNNVKSEMECEDDHSQLNNQNRIDDLKYMAVIKVKMENDNNLSNEGDLNACTSNLNEDFGVDGVDNNDPISQDDSCVCSSNLDEDVDVIDIISQNDKINRNYVSKCSLSLEEDTVVDAVSIDNDGIINQDIVNDEVISNNSLVYAARLFENTFRDVLKVKYCDVSNEVVSTDEKSSSDYLEHQHSFLFSGEDVPGSLSTQLKHKVEKVTETLQNLIKDKVDKQQTPEADGGPSIDDMLHCDICPYQTKNDVQLLEHLKVHAAAMKTYHCDMCDYKSNRKHNLIYHIETHFGPFSCNVCKKIFKNKRLLNIHMKIHSHQKRYFCDFCKKAFNYKRTLKIHLLQHKGIKPYACDFCKKAFFHKKNLNIHLLIHTDEKPYACDICKKAFTRASSLRSHLLIHSNKKPYACDFCKKAFKVKNTLNLHLLIHTGEKPHACDICKKAFARVTSLKSHLLIHSGEKPYTCDLCKKAFIRKRALKSHLLIHFDKQPYKCEVCKKRFLCSRSLKLHSLIHTGEKPYSCVSCRKSFRLKHHLKAHLKIHYGDSRSPL